MNSPPKEVKQVIVVRKDLNMRKGKIAAQVAHASMGVLLKAMKRSAAGQFLNIQASFSCDAPMYHWLTGPFTKICVSVDSEEELNALVSKAMEEGIIHCKVTDAGKTEFNGVSTVTCAAFGPCWSEELDNLTGHLKLL